MNHPVTFPGFVLFLAILPSWWKYLLNGISDKLVSMVNSPAQGFDKAIVIVFGITTSERNQIGIDTFRSKKIPYESIKGIMIKGYCLRVYA